ncbi:MAG: hypothetical protein J6B29_00570 [Clostridia bacterium]|nr:hypothetical protein [Clostridia bacterium]
MRDFFQRWEKELEGKMPNLRQDILDEPIPKKENNIVKSKSIAWRYLCVVAGMVAIVVLCISLIPMLMVENSDIDNGEIVLTVEINPRIMMLSDSEGIVTQVIATNKDADVILSVDGFKENVEGKTISEALIAYVDYASLLGYIDVNKTDNAVKITSCDNEVGKKALKMAKESLSKHLSDNGIEAVIEEQMATIEDVCQINEIDIIPSIKELKESFNGKSPLFSSRKIDSLDGEELEDYFKTYLIDDKIKNDIKESLEQLSSISEIVEKGEMILKLIGVTGGDDLLKKLDEIKDNPLYPKELKLVIEEMQDAITSMEENCGIKIESYNELLELRDKYPKEKIEDLLRDVDNLGEESLMEYKKILDSLGRDSSIIDKVINMPQSKEEMMKEAENRLKKEGNDRLEENRGGQNKSPENNEQEPIHCPAYPQQSTARSEHGKSSESENNKEKK